MMKIQFALILFTVLTNVAIASVFEGQITYELTRSVSPIKGIMIVRIKDNLVRFEMFAPDKKNQYTNKTFAVRLDLNTQKIIKVRFAQYSVLEIDASLPMEKTFLQPEEMVSLQKRNRLMGYDTEEYESFYFHNKHRLQILAWYAPQLTAGPSMKPVWHLNPVGAPRYIYLFHPIYKMLALKTSMKAIDGAVETLTAIEVKPMKLTEEDLSVSFKKP